MMNNTKKSGNTFGNSMSITTGYLRKNTKKKRKNILKKRMGNNKLITKNTSISKNNNAVHDLL